ncbi:hypothetical protein [Methylobacter svalbardensis]|uniref:hypothetical protein n=1 Tax=Methylobacter svalbardensis TaxID=3080016 RepID=UPI0030EDA4B8
MLQQRIHMRDQVTNRIEIIMGDDKPSFAERLEEFATSLLFVAIIIFLIRI